MASKTKGLLLTLGGAPNTPHVIEGLPGYYSPTVPHPVGDDLSLDAAKQAAKDHKTVLKLVDISAAEEADAQEAHEVFKDAGRNALLGARRDGRANDDPSRTDDEIDALKEAE